METFIVIIAFSLMFALWLAAAWLDKKHGWRMVDWLNSGCGNPFINERHHAQLKEKDQIIRDLSERVQVLEKLVTEPAYELNKKINQL